MRASQGDTTVTEILDWMILQPKVEDVTLLVATEDDIGQQPAQGP